MLYKPRVQGHQNWYSQLSNTQIHKYKFTNTQIQIHKYTNTVYDEVPEIPNICCIFEQLVVQGCQKWYSQVIRSEIRLSKDLKVQLLTSDFCIVPFGLSIQETFLNVWIQEEMRDTNESTNSRVLYFSLFSMCCLLGLATWQVRSQTSNLSFKSELSDWWTFQVLYLRKFFKSKKLIE